jgi:CheY-like chemotaxis protein
MKTGQSGKILIVDDDVRNRKLMLAMLSPLGHELQVAEDGGEALELISSFVPDLVLLDVIRGAGKNQGRSRE